MNEKKLVRFLAVVLLVLSAIGPASATPKACDISNMEYKIKAPDGTETSWRDLSFESKSGSCPPAVKEIWKTLNVYDFCPLEGPYKIKARAFARDIDGTGKDGWHETDWVGAFTVDYCASQKWCNCSGHNWVEIDGANLCNWVGKCYSELEKPVVAVNPGSVHCQEEVEITAQKTTVDEGNDLAIKKWEFEFSNGTNETHTENCTSDCPTKKITRSFSSVDTIEVRVRATDELDNKSPWSDKATIQITADPNMPPTAVINVSPGPYYRNEPITFDGSGSYDNEVAPNPQDLPLSYSWSTGNTTPSIQKSFATLGDHSVDLTVTDSRGAVSPTATATITVENRPPKAIIEGPDESNKNIEVTFSGAHSNDPDGDTITNYKWFVDGTEEQSGPSAVFKKTFVNAGNYTIKLEVTESEGATGSSAHEIKIVGNPPAKPVVTANPKTGNAPLTVKFNASTIDGDTPPDKITIWEWDFDGDGSADIGETQNCTDCPHAPEKQYVFGEGGTFEVRAKAYDESGDSSDWSNPVEISVIEETALKSVQSEGIEAGNSTKITLICNKANEEIKVTIENLEGNKVYDSDDYLGAGIGFPCGTSSNPAKFTPRDASGDPLIFTEAGSYLVKAKIIDETKCTNCSATCILKVNPAELQIESPELHPLLVLVVLAAVLFVMRNRKKQII